MAADKFKGQGGRYVMEGGEKRLVERTEHHTQGDRARDVKGNPISAGRGAAAAFVPAAKPDAETRAKPKAAAKARGD